MAFILDESPVDSPLACQDRILEKRSRSCTGRSTQVRLCVLHMCEATPCDAMSAPAHAVITESQCFIPDSLPSLPSFLVLSDRHVSVHLSDQRWAFHLLVDIVVSSNSPMIGGAEKGPPRSDSLLPTKISLLHGLRIGDVCMYY